MAAESWLRTVDRTVEDHQRGIYTSRELRARIMDLMPVEAVAALVSRLPQEVVAQLCDLASETATYSEDDWVSLITINGPQPTALEREQYRLKCAALQRYFESH